MMHHYSIIIQIAIFLGVFIAGVISASWNGGDFIMGILNILLFFAAILCCSSSQQRAVRLSS